MLFTLLLLAYGVVSEALEESDLKCTFIEAANQCFELKPNDAPNALECEKACCSDEDCYVFQFYGDGSCWIGNAMRCRPDSINLPIDKTVSVGGIKVRDTCPTVWICIGNNVFARYTSDGAQCYSSTGADCDWGSCEDTTPPTDEGMPITCGDNHKEIYGDRGYYALDLFCPVVMSLCIRELCSQQYGMTSSLPSIGTSVRSVEGCQILCTYVPWCRAYDYSSAKCSLYDQVGHVYQTDTGFNGICPQKVDVVLPDEGDCDCFPGEYTRDRITSIGKLHDIPSLEYCKMLCIKSEQCLGITYSYVRSMCWLSLEVVDIEIYRSDYTSCFCKDTIPLPPEVKVQYVGNTAKLKIIPRYSGGPPILHYITTMHIDGTPTTPVNVSEPYLEVPVPHGSSVRVEVRAVNQVGESLPTTTERYDVPAPVKSPFPIGVLLVVGFLTLLVAYVFYYRFIRRILPSLPEDFGNRFTDALLGAGARLRGDRNVEPRGRNAEPSAPPPEVIELSEIVTDGSSSNLEPARLADESAPVQDIETENDAQAGEKKRDNSMSNICRISLGEFEDLSELSVDVCRPYPCRYCGSKFMNVSQRNQHEKPHKGELVICSICLKGFTRVYSRDRHIRNSHEGITQQCPICSRYIKGDNLKTHVAKQHGDSSPWECEHCNYRKERGGFFAKRNLQNHIKKLHPDCEICHQILGSLKKRSTKHWRGPGWHKQALRVGKEIDGIHDPSVPLLGDTVPAIPTFGYQNDSDLKCDLQQMQLDVTASQLDEPFVLNEFQEPQFNAIDNPCNRTEFPTSINGSPFNETKTPFDVPDFLKDDFGDSTSTVSSLIQPRSESDSQLELMSGILNPTDQEGTQPNNMDT